MCYCLPGFIGDPFNGCHLKPPEPKVPVVPQDPCHPSPCGSNAICTSRNGAGSCKCIPDHFGDPYTGCRPECVVNGMSLCNLMRFENKSKSNLSFQRIVLTTRHAWETGVWTLVLEFVGQMLNVMCTTIFQLANVSSGLSVNGFYLNSFHSFL